MRKKKIIITGGNGRFAKVLRKFNPNFLYPNKNQLNILNLNSIRSYVKKNKVKYIIHNAALSRPMEIHNSEIAKSIDINIIGTCNMVKICNELNIKLIYFSTGYVYEGKKGNYKEEDPVKPINNYAWSKMGGECAVQMYKNSLILRITMTEKPFQYKQAFTNLISNFMYHEDLVKILPSIINKKGILNVGGKQQSVYNFAKSKKINVKKAKLSKSDKIPANQGMNISKLKKIL